MLSMTEIRQRFIKKHVTNQYQLRRFLPRRYLDNTHETGILVDSYSVIIGTMVSCDNHKYGDRQSFIKIVVLDRLSNRRINIPIFNQPYKYNNYHNMLGQTVIAAGDIKQDIYGYTMSRVTCVDTNITNWMKIIPVYSKISGISDERMKMFIDGTLNYNDYETVPLELRQKYGLYDINTALRMANFPITIDAETAANHRLAFDDLYYMAARFEISTRTAESNGIKLSLAQRADKIIDTLPYKLTDDQMSVYSQIKQSLMTGSKVKALVQGDVSCGKTIVAFLIAILFAENGYQSAIMAPTKILARQHFDKLTKLLEPTGYKVLLISGKKITKKQAKQLSDGEYLFVIGTHGILSDTVIFHNLGLVVIDEEHKFGVAQRQMIKDKQLIADSISMTATPTPRTLARAIYGNDVQVYSIHTMPGCRKKTITQYDNGDNIQQIVTPILQRHEQVYVVCPAIDVDEEVMPDVLDTSHAVAIYRKMFPNYNVQEINGSMSVKQTEQTIGDFKNGSIDILISTTVIEVGVDVPNATMIIIQNAERFGLAGMHQLRGRVGRGDKQSYCLLVSQKSPEDNQRISALLSVSDGFKIAEIDMQLRQTGTLFGERQSGFNKCVDEMLAYHDLFADIQQSIKHIDTQILMQHIFKMETYIQAEGTKN